ncbi:MAG: M23 family metallopeptidase [Lachnospiraceae bacterium]|nr:M23 family metallopeptidase [Lachnospiraceae bacterium]
MDIGKKLRKVIITVIVVVAALIPTMIAIAKYQSVEKTPVKEGSVSSMRLTLPDGTEKTYDVDTLCEEPSIGEDAIGYFMRLHKNAGEIMEIPDLEPGRTAVVKAVYTSYKKEYEYTYYFTSDSSHAYYTDSDGKCYRVTEQDALAFLQSSFAETLYASSVPPMMKIGEETVLPAGMKWYYQSYDDVFRETEGIPLASSVPSFLLQGPLGLVFDLEPDYLNVVMKNGGTVAYEGQLSGIRPELLTENATYSVEIDARWYQTDLRTGYGEATYRIEETVLAPVVFSIADTEVLPGEFIVISAKNAVDPEGILFSCEPAITASPVFLRDGEDYCRALLPIGIGESGKTFRIKLKYGETEQIFEVKSKDYQYTPFNNFDMPYDTAVLRSAANEQAFYDELRAVLSSASEPRHFTSEPLELPPTSNYIRYGFGRTCEVKATAVIFVSPFTHYIYLGARPDVTAVADGKVVYVGRTAMTGNTVVIDHGLGLKSVYCCMGDPSVTVGSTVKRGDKVGTIGKTGFTEYTGFAFGLYVFDTPVGPFSAQDEGILF